MKRWRDTRKTERERVCHLNNHIHNPLISLRIAKVNDGSIAVSSPSMAISLHDKVAIVNALLIVVVLKWGRSLSDISE